MQKYSWKSQSIVVTGLIGDRKKLIAKVEVDLKFESFSNKQFINDVTHLGIEGFCNDNA